MRASDTPTSPARRWPFLLLLLLAGLVATNLLRRKTSPSPPPLASGMTPPSGASLPTHVLEDFLRIEDREKQVAATTWATEESAQSWGGRIEAFWNQLNRRRGELSPLLSLPFRHLTIPTVGPSVDLPFGIRAWSGDASAPRIEVLAADPRFSVWLRDGWGLQQSEWRHVRFQPAAGTNPPVSTFEIHLHLTRTTPPARAQIAARARFAWPSSDALQGPTDAPDITVEELQILHRAGPPAFQEIAQIEIPPFPRTTWIDPLIAATAEASSTPHFLLAARNLQVSRTADGSWTAAPFTPHHPGLVFTAVLADFNGDANDDLLFAVRNGLLLLPGGPGGSFENPAVPAWLAPERMLYSQALTCGDIDHDGDLDVFLGQYRTPYESGQMPRPYFNALDGPPAFLLRNGGTGKFEDITAGSGLEAKRHRRTYGASFADLDGDGDQDLLVTSDFAGCDVHANDGQGHFSDRTGVWLDESKAFGMSHAFSDFDADGVLDFFVAGMPQPTADRLGALGLERPETPTWLNERSKVTTGNRLFFGGPAGFRQRPAGATVARAGWAWSAAVLDLDQDRFPDLHIVNGHETRQSVRDYEREFWLHDIYVGDSQPRPAVDAYFASKFSTSRGEGWSYGGYDKNRFFLNRGAAGFLEIGHVLGLALELDSRNTLAHDVDADGDADLLVTTFEVWPKPRQTLRILENTLPRQGHWIAIQPGPRPDRRSAVGAIVTVRDRSGRQVRTLVTGDGYRSQQAAVAHFGLGEVSSVDEAEIRWSDGIRAHALGLAADRHHVLVPVRP